MSSSPANRARRGLRGRNSLHGRWVRAKAWLQSYLVALAAVWLIVVLFRFGVSGGVTALASIAELGACALAAAGWLISLWYGRSASAQTRELQRRGNAT